MIRQSLEPISTNNMSNAIPTIPNFCSYETFKRGFSEGLGTYCEPCVPSVNKILPSTIRLCYWGKLHCVQATDCVDINNNGSQSVRKAEWSWKPCDWFDAYSVRLEQHVTVRTPETGEQNGIEDHYQDIEDDFNKRITGAVLRSDSGLSSGRTSSRKLKSRKHLTPFEASRNSRGHYSSKKGCIDWLQTCDNELKTTASHRDLLRCFEEQFRHHQFGGPSKKRSSGSGMFGYCTTHIERKLGTNTSSEDLPNLTVGENYLEEEVFQDDMYYLGYPQVCYTVLYQSRPSLNLPL